MKNQLALIGRLVVELESARQPAEVVDCYSMLAQEFKRIHVAFGQVWIKSGNEVSYLLEFHYAEATRLLNKVKFLREQFQFTEDSRSGKELLGNLYVILISGLSELAEHLAVLRNQDPKTALTR